MTAAPDTGRTAEEDEFREALITFIADRFWRTPGQAANHADALLADPLAQLQADLIAARKERDEALKLRKEDRAWYEMTVSVVEEQREDYRADSLRLHREKMDRLDRSLAAEANLIALAKMYGEACWKMVQALACVQDLSTYNLALGEDKRAAEAEAAQLRSRLLQAEMGGEAMRWSTDWAAAARHKGDIIAGAYSSQGCWRQAVVGYAAGIFWDWPFGEKPTHWRHLDKPPALNPNQEAGNA